MAIPATGDQEFIEKLTHIALEKLEDEHFGGKELAVLAGINYYTLNRRLRATCRKSPGQFIRELRLQQSMELLLDGSMTVAEVAYRVGFASPAYFNKCFHDHYGYPPGEARNRKLFPSREGMAPQPGRFVATLKKGLWPVVGILALLSMGFFILPVIQKHRANEAFRKIPEKSIAVIPVSNFTGNQELDYFASGVHEGVISELGKISELLVKSRTSTMRYAGGSHSLHEIAGELGVKYIVEGSVMGSADSLIVTIQLIEVFPRERHIWSASYYQDWQNLFTIYREVTFHIAESIHLSLSPVEQAHLEKDRVVDPALYNLFMRGRFHLNKLTQEGFELGLDYLLQASAIDPLEPLPYLGLAVAYSDAGHASPAGDDAGNLALEYAHKALALDSNLAEAHAVLAAHYLYTAWDFEKADHALGRAIAINPNMAMVRYTMGWYNLIFGETEKAVSEMKQAVEIDPLNPICTGYLGWLYLWLDRFDEAIAEGKKTLEIDPNYIMGHYVIGSALAEQGKPDEAIAMHQQGVDINPGFLCGLGVAYARAGKKEQALEVAARLEQHVNAWNAWGLSDIYATLGDIEKGMQWVETAFQLRQDFIPWMNRNPYYKPLFNEPRFKEISMLLQLPQ
jgi:TolB-like protein/AraC-like DNA-binding protein/Tfp pilus assembly protein PilF